MSQNNSAYFEIDAPMLKHFELTCFPTSSFCFKKSPLVIILVASHNDWVVDDILEGGKCNFIQFFDSLPGLQKVYLNYTFIKVFLIINIVP